MSINITNEDNMKLMARYPDNHFDLAIVDPPYGISVGKMRLGKGKNMADKKWDDNTPNQEYFDELFRVSKNQIIWGANHFILPLNRAWIYWDKMQDGFGKDFSSGELAWTSFNKPMKQIRYKYQGNYEGFENNITTKSSKPELLKIHPTQKPVALYSWLLQNYAKEGDKIVDTHIGSGSIAIAVDNANKIDKMNLTLIGCELDKDYYNATMKRIKEQTSWQSLF
jgi:site-specific DNA-methyltransferase (adenine-specific)